MENDNFRQPPEMANFLFFAANRNGKPAFVFLGLQTTNGIPRLLF
jgi:hypothetical protein